MQIVLVLVLWNQLGRLLCANVAIDKLALFEDYLALLGGRLAVEDGLVLLVGGATRSCSQSWIGELLTGLLMVKLLLLLTTLCRFVAVVLAPTLVVAFLDEQLALGTHMSLHQLLLVLPESP